MGEYTVDTGWADTYYPKYVERYNACVNYANSYCQSYCPKDPICNQGSIKDILEYFMEVVWNPSGYVNTYPYFKRYGSFKAYTKTEFLNYFCTEIPGEPYSLNAPAIVDMITSLSYRVQSTLQRSRCVYRYTIGNFDVDSLTKSLQQQGKLYPGTVVTASIEITSDSISDNDKPYDIFFNGAKIGSFTADLPAKGTDTFDITFMVPNVPAGQYELKVEEAS